MRWWCLGLLVGCGVGTPADDGTADAPAPVVVCPDVLLVTLDTTRADRLGSYGHARADTPNLDALAAAGRRYDRAYSPRPFTIPAHTAIFTAQYPSRLGQWANGDGVLPASSTTLAERLADGCWSTAASVGAFVTTRRWGFDQGFDTYLDDVPTDGRSFWRGERPAEEVVDDALGWWADTEPGRFLWVHLFDPHFPYAPPEGFVDPDDPRPYDGELAYVDEQVGRLVAQLDLDEDLVVVVGDHGEGLGEHGELGHGLFAYESTQRVPWILAGKGIDPEVVTQPVSLVDVAPTLLDLLGRPPLPSADGIVRPSPTPTAVPVATWSLARRFGLAPHVGLVDGDLKLLDLPTPELYDVVADPGEQDDLAAARPADVARLRSTLAALSLPPPPADVVPDPTAALQALGYVGEGGMPEGDLRDPKEATDLLVGVQRAERLTLTGQRDEAIAALRALVASNPEIAELRLRLATALVRVGQNAEAASVVDAGLASSPRDPHLLAHKAAHLAGQGRLAEAGEVWVRVALATPYAPRMRALAVTALRHGGERAKARRLGEEWLAQHPDDVQLAGAHGVTLAIDGDVAAAMPLLKQGLEGSPPEAEVAFYVASWHLGGGRLVRGQKLLEEEVAHHAGHLRAWRVLAQLSSRLSDWSTQERAARQVVQRAPDDGAAHHLLVLALFNQGRFAEARAAADAGLARVPDHPDLVLMDANLLAKEGDVAAGQARFEEAQALRAARMAADDAARERAAEAPELQEGQPLEPQELPSWRAEDVLVEDHGG